MPALDRTKLIQDAHTTLAALSDRGYDGPRGRVDLTADLARLEAGTRLYTPEQLRATDRLLEPGPHDTLFTVTRETTLAAARRVLGERPGPVSVLNFASATSTGGGFLTGSAAQEESLCRASGLYASLNRHPEYYERHRSQRDRLYSDHLMFAQDVPVLRDDDGRWLDRPYHMDVLTAAAPNLRGVDGAELDGLRPQAERAIEVRASLLLWGVPARPLLPAGAGRVGMRGVPERPRARRPDLPWPADDGTAPGGVRGSGVRCVRHAVGGNQPPRLPADVR